jgi:xanthine dehydrogenase accessory factor
MTDLEPILSLWRELDSTGSDYVLATIVAVEGSSYRRPGACMLLAQDGRRAGTVSGGCLEAEVSKRAFWLTENGPAVEQFSTFEDDGERPYGSGCGGLVSILLERCQTAEPLLRSLEIAFNQRTPIAIATILEGPETGQRAFASSIGTAADAAQMLRAPSFFQRSGEKVGDLESTANLDCDKLQSLADRALENRFSIEQRICVDGARARAWADFRPARPGLWIFGAGDDARPLLNLARELGWFVAVADGRSNLATRDRFSAAGYIGVLDIAALPGSEFARFELRPTDAAVVMTHSFEQDSRILASLLSLEIPPAYIGVLGPQRRTREMLAEVSRLLKLPADDAQIQKWLALIHAPTGLDLGADTPASIALSILAEIQQSFKSNTGEPLRLVRAAKLEGARP